MTWFGGVRLFSAIEILVFAALLVVAIGDLGETPKAVLGWTHGVGWIVLCVLVYIGCVRRVFPWPLLAATVSPLGPVGSTAGLEWLAHRARRTGANRPVGGIRGTRPRVD